VDLDRELAGSMFPHLLREILHDGGTQFQAARSQEMAAFELCQDQFFGVCKQTRFVLQGLGCHDVWTVLRPAVTQHLAWPVGLDLKRFLDLPDLADKEPTQLL
jgi:hypothetical protein